MEPVDCLAYIGRNPMDADNIYIATGDSGMGMTHGHIAAMLLTDLIIGQENPWARLYSPSRVRFKAIGTYFSENLNVARKYGHWVLPQAVKEANEIGEDSAPVIRRGLRE